MKVFRLLGIVVILALLLAACGPAPAEPTQPPAAEAPTAEQPAAEAPTAEQPAAAESDWARQPMAETTTVVLSVESGAQEKTFISFHDQLLADMNIDLQVVAHPFSEQYEIQYLDLSSGAGQFDILSYWPLYIADFYNWLEPLGNIAPGGEEQVAKDIDYEGVMPGYAWCYVYKDKFYAVQYDGDVKLLHYRYDLMNDETEKEGFKAKYGYDLDINNLTWDQYLEVAQWFGRPDEDFFGTAEIAGFLAGFFLKDRLVGMGGHLFSYEDMMAFEGESATGESNFDICVKAVKNGQDIFNTGSPPEAHSYEFEDARNQIITHGRVAMVPQWPDVWKWANDPALGNADKAVCKVAAAEMPGFLKDGQVVQRPDENGGRVLTINKASKVKEAAYKTLVYFSDPKFTTELVYNNDTWLDPYRKDHVVPEAAAHLCQGCEWNCDLYMDVITKSTVDGYPALQIPGAGRYTEVLERWAKKAFANQVTPEETCKGIQEEFNQITDEIGRDAQIKEYQAYVDTVLKPKNMYP